MKKNISETEDKLSTMDVHYKDLPKEEYSANTKNVISFYF